MTIQVQGIIDSARRLLRQTDADNSNWTDSDLLGFLNDRLIGIAEAMHLNRKVVSYSGTDDNYYPIPSDCLSIQLVMQQGSILPPIRLEEAEIVNGVATGKWGYTIHGDRLYVVPITNGTADLYYIAKLPDIESVDNSLDVPHTAKMPIVFGLVADAFMSIKETDSAAYYEAKYEAQLAASKQSERDRQYPTPRAPDLPRYKR